MPNIKTDGIALMALLAVTIPVIGWIVWQMLPERVWLAEGAIIKAERWRRESIALTDIERILFHYHAVVGFISAWEFLSKDGRSLDVSGDARGIEQMLTKLEAALAGFSMSNFKREFAAGDVEDTIEVWRRFP